MYLALAEGTQLMLIAEGTSAAWSRKHGKARPHLTAGECPCCYMFTPGPAVSAFTNGVADSGKEPA